MPTRTTRPKTSTHPDGPTVLRAVLASAEPRPSATASPQQKNLYAGRFATAMAATLARDLAVHFPGIEATASRSAQSMRATKQLDIGFSTPQLGLALGISLKSVHLREAAGSGRYTHNLKRNEEELRIEAAGYHRRQPYAVMVGILFVPFDSCTDARSARTSSSFGSWVRHLRPFAHRSGPHDEADCFERLYIGLYEPDGSDLAFFDIRTAPPKNGKPRRDGSLFGAADQRGAPVRTLSYAELLREVRRCYLERNSVDFVWADGEKEPIDEVSGNNANEPRQDR